MAINIPYTRQLANLAVDPNEPNLVGGWDMWNSGSSVVDQSSGGNDGALNGRFAIERTAIDRQIRFVGVDGYIDIGDISANLNTIAFWINPITTTEDLIDLDGGTHTISISAGTITATGFSSPTIYVNGVVSPTVVANLTSFVVITTEIPFAVSDLDIGRISTGYYDGSFIGSIKIFNTVKDAVWVSSQYRRGYSALWQSAEGIQLTPGNVAGGPLSNSTLQVVSGSWNVTQTTINGISAVKVGCFSAGFAYMDAGHLTNNPFFNAYGIWNWWITKSPGSTTRLLISATKPELQTFATQNGYYFSYASNGRIFFLRTTNGSSTTLFNTDIDVAAGNTWHKNKMIRDNDGQFSFYFNNILQPVTTGTNPVTDNNHKQSFYLCFDFDGGDGIVWGGPNAFAKRIIA